MATFNGERHLSAQLDSLKDQTRAPHELVVFDDASADRTPALVAAYERTAPFPVRIVRNPVQLGYRSNFMRAALACSGDLIAFCDQDDVWAPDKLERMRDAFTNPETLIAFHNARVTDESGKPMGRVFRRVRNATYDPLTFEPWIIVPGFTQVIRRSLLEFSDLHDQSADMFCPTELMPHDQWFLFLASVLGKIAYVPDVLADYRQHGENTSGWLPARRLVYMIHSARFARYYADAASLAADNRIDLLSTLHERRPEIAEALKNALARYRRIQLDARRRSELYAERSLFVRTRKLFSLAKDGTFTHRGRYFGQGHLLLDACVGVPFANVLTTRAPL